MNPVVRVGLWLWQWRLPRWLMAVAIGATVGIAAGHTLIASVAGSISVVAGGSMLPTFESGARVYTVPIASPLERGDIVLLDDGSGQPALKRVVGMPGETIEFWRGYVFINGIMLREPYLPKYTFTFSDEHTGVYSFKVGRDHYFMLGDNRTTSLDSRVYGPIPRQQVKARVPAPDHPVRPHLAPFRLPDPGKTTIQHL